MQLRSTLSTLLLLPLFAFSQNYDEAKVGDYTLPDPLISLNQTRITTSKQWESSRRAEILTLFENNVYGVMPRDFDRLEFKVVNENNQAMEGKAHLKETDVTIFRGGKSVTIHVLLFTPVGAKKRVPVFLLINNRPVSNTMASREVKSEFWPAEQVIDAGYGIAAFHVADAAPDNKDKFQQGVLQLYPEALSQSNGMKAIGAWAWAASRVMDYFMKEPLIDKNKVIVVGHSRGGKTSLWTAAQDPRFAMCVTNNSGNTGAALSKRNFGETVAIINRQFPHWFNGNYKKYNDKEADLPVDQHMLIALIAPRPVYSTNATEDLWADPTGTWLALKHAEPVYNLYKAQSLLPANPPAPDTPVIQKTLSYHNRTGKHDMTSYDWTQFIKQADLYFK